MVNLAQLDGSSRRVGVQELKASGEGGEERPQLPLLLKERNPETLFSPGLLKGGIPELGAFSHLFRWFNAKHSVSPIN